MYNNQEQKFLMKQINYLIFIITFELLSIESYSMNRYNIIDMDFYRASLVCMSRMLRCIVGRSLSST